LQFPPGFACGSKMVGMPDGRTHRPHLRVQMHPQGLFIEPVRSMVRMERRVMEMILNFSASSVDGSVKTADFKTLSRFFWTLRRTL
jgi:hypothetical protein